LNIKRAVQSWLAGFVYIIFDKGIVFICTVIRFKLGNNVTHSAPDRLEFYDYTLEALIRFDFDFVVVYVN